MTLANILDIFTNANSGILLKVSNDTENLTNDQDDQVELLTPEIGFQADKDSGMKKTKHDIHYYDLEKIIERKETSVLKIYKYPWNVWLVTNRKSHCFTKKTTPISWFRLNMMKIRKWRRKRYLKYESGNHEYEQES